MICLQSLQASLHLQGSALRLLNFPAQHSITVDGVITCLAFSVYQQAYETEFAQDGNWKPLWLHLNDRASFPIMSHL